MKKLLFLIVAVFAISTTAFSYSQKIYLRTLSDDVHYSVEFTNPGTSIVDYTLHIYCGFHAKQPWRWLYARIQGDFANGNHFWYSADEEGGYLNPGQHKYVQGRAQSNGSRVTLVSAWCRATWVSLGDYASVKASW